MNEEQKRSEAINLFVQSEVFKAHLAKADKQRVAERAAKYQQIESIRTHCARELPALTAERERRHRKLMDAKQAFEAAFAEFGEAQRAELQLIRGSAARQDVLRAELRRNAWPEVDELRREIDAVFSIARGRAGDRQLTVEVNNFTDRRTLVIQTRQSAWTAFLAFVRETREEIEQLYVAADPRSRITELLAESRSWLHKLESADEIVKIPLRTKEDDDDDRHRARLN